MEHPPNCIACVGFPAAVPGVYDYSIPESLRGKIAPGTPVLVEVRRTKMWGVVVRVQGRSEYPNLKPIAEARLERWTRQSASLVSLYEWIASYYQCDIGKVFKPLVRKSLLRSTPKQQTIYRALQTTSSTLSPSQSRALERIRSSGQTVIPSPVLFNEWGLGRSVVETLCRKGVLAKEKRTVVRNAEELGLAESFRQHELTEEQTSAVESIGADLRAPGSPFLLHGITGSGKTLVYIALAKQALRRGKGAIILVPEISLTPQTVARFKAGIGDEVAVIHSRMSTGERRDSLEQLVVGKKSVVIGARSAVLVPLKSVGLIVVDEEHDGSYKQAETDPRYNARDVAVMRGRLQKAVVVLGSATPSMESYYNARTGKYRLVTLKKRYGRATLPRVEIVDMGQEHKENNWTFMSRLLRERIQHALESRRQCVLLLNRRGFSRSLICKDCGHAYECPNCSVKLIYHRAETVLKCHQCGYCQVAPQTCAKCRGDHIQYKGTGIQKAEEFIGKEFPQARVLRMDQDSTRKRGAHVSILDRFARREADILLGTQMVAKGLDFPGVLLVGVLNADIGLSIPDFRSSERTFQLLAQVAGRAGREDELGEVVIQTYFPKEQAILSARDHNFEEFYTAELEERRRLGYPPLGRLARVLVEGPDHTRVATTAGKLGAIIRQLGGESLAILGPSPAAIPRVNMRHRHSLVIKARSSRALQSVLRASADRFPRMPKNMKLVVDVDPVSML